MKEDARGKRIPTTFQLRLSARRQGVGGRGVAPLAAGQISLIALVTKRAKTKTAQL
jgi:hypothetical protein